MKKKEPWRVPTYYEILMENHRRQRFLEVFSFLAIVAVGVILILTYVIGPVTWMRHV